VRSVVLVGAWLGALAALASGQTWAQLLAGAGAVLLALLAYRDRRGVYLAVAVLGVLLLAWLRWQAATDPPDANSVAWWADSERRTVIGRVTARPELRGATQRFVVAVSAIDTDAGRAPVDGSVQVRVSVSRTYRAGDLVRLDGVLEPPPELEDFDYRAYLARRGVYAVMEYPRVRVEGHAALRGPAAWLEALRERAHDALWRGLPADQAALAEGILLGRRAEIPRDVNEDFQRAGVTHLIVISGFNIALVGGLVLGATSWLIGRRRAGLVAVAAIAAYSIFVGLTPPVARAAVMGGIAVLAMLSGRPHGGGTALVFAAAALALEDPRILNDLSFQLSFAATAGLVVLTPPMLDWGRRALGEMQRAEGPSWRSLAYATWAMLAVTLAATAATLPLLLVSFGRVSLVAPLANLALVPLFPALLVSGALGTAVAVLLPSTAAIALAPVGGLLDLSITIARWCAAVPGASVPLGGFTSIHAALAYALLAVAALGRVPGRRPPIADVVLHPPAPLLVRPLPFLAFAPAMLVALAVGSALVQRQSPSNETRVEVFNLAGATVALVTLPGGGRVLVDTGLAPGEARAALDRALPAGAPLAAIVITRDAPSASNGLPEVLGRYRAGVLLVPPEAEDAAWVDEARSRGVVVAALRPRLTIGDGRAHLEIVPAPEAGRWLVRVHHGEREIALGGAEGEAGVARGGQQTSLYVRSDGSRLSAALRAGESATLTTNGSGLRLGPPKGRSLTVERCLLECGSQGND